MYFRVGGNCRQACKIPLFTPAPCHEEVAKDKDNKSDDDPGAPKKITIGKVIDLTGTGEVGSTSMPFTGRVVDYGVAANLNKASDPPRSF